MKKAVLFFLLCLSCFVSIANHTKGGWMYYEYLGPGTMDTSKNLYKIVLVLYMKCDHTPQQLDQSVNFTFFNGSNNQFLQTINVPLSASPNIVNCSTPDCDPCIVNKPDICYTYATYQTVQELAPSVDGYTIAYQRCCRIAGIVNIINSNNVGDTWTIKIPGTADVLTAPQNSSPKFIANDTAVICNNNPFTFEFTATDADGDLLVYEFAPAYTGGTTNTPSPGIASPPPYSSVQYNGAFSAFQPLGPGVTINPNTGIVSGIAPGIGQYVLTAVAKEYRNGKYIGESRKSLHINVANCNPLTPALDPDYLTCDGFTMTFSNKSSNPPGIDYFWDFGDPKSGTQNISTLSNPTHTYSDTGIFILKLRISLKGQCTDSTTSIVKVYPGFFPAFTSTGQCKNTPIQLTDKSQTNYGVVNSWSWDFGDASTLADTSHLQNPKYTYSASGNYDVSLIVTNSKGCTDTIMQPVTIQDKPDFTVTNDTLICSIDTLQLNTFGSGTSFWTPNININDQNSTSPLVSPDVPTTYYVTLTDPFGCIGKDSVFIDVKRFVTIDAGKDTGVCIGDAVKLNITSDALSFKWTPAASLDNDTSKNPTATPLATTTYLVIGNIGKCQSTDFVKVRVSPYPVVTPIPDTVLCFGNSIQLIASGGSKYTWSPAFFLNDANIPNPVARPDRSIRYIVTITDTLGCPKPVFDTVVIMVQKVTADAGPRDTSIVENQPLQLNATGGQFYLWTPPTGLDNSAIGNPVATLTENINYIVRVSTTAGCFATDTISVSVYNVLPSIFVPTAFTPNGDGRNDLFRPIAAGIKQINQFKVFNRWGVLMYSSEKIVYEQNMGWDGRYKGQPQDSDIYVWIVEGVNYQDKKITQKGTVLLVR